MSRRMKLLIARPALVSALACAVGVGAVTSATAATNPVITDCNAHARLTRTYSATQLKQALSTLPAEVKQYTDCSDVINRALLAELGGQKGGGTGGGGGSGGSFLPTPVIVIVVLLVLAGATFGALAIRRRREPGDGTAGGPRRPVRRPTDPDRPDPEPTDPDRPDSDPTDPDRPDSDPTDPDRPDPGG